MTVSISPKLSGRLESPVLNRAEELMGLVKARHSQARFIGPTYSPEEDLWLIEAYFDEAEDFELQDHLSEYETDILLADNIWLCVLCLPLAEIPA